MLKTNSQFTVNGFKQLNEIGDGVCNKANILCEYKIRSYAFKNIRNIVDGVQAKFMNIKNRRIFLFFNRAIVNKIIYSYLENLNLQNITVVTKKCTIYFLKIEDLYIFKKNQICFI